MESDRLDVDVLIDQPRKFCRPKNKNQELLFEKLKELIQFDDDSKELAELICENPEILDLQDQNGNTLLHLAADHSHLNVVSILLKAGIDPNIKNNDDQTPLHTVVDGGDGCRCHACNERNVTCVKMLIEANSKIDEKDYASDTPLGTSALCLMPDCARVLYENHADLNSRNDRNEEVGVLVSKYIPQEVQKWLRENITSYKEDDDYIELDFRVLLRASSDDEKETKFLMYMTKGGKKAREKLLLEPLVQAYLYLKWEAVGKLFLLLRIAYLALVLLYTCFIFAVFLYKCPYEVLVDSNEDLDQTTFTTTTTPDTAMNQRFRTQPPKFFNFILSQVPKIPEDNGEENDDDNCKPTVWIYIMTSVLIAFVVCMVLNEIYEMWYHGPKKYTSIGLNYGWWTMIITVTLNLLPVFMDIIGSWQYPVAAFGVFLAWGMFLSQLARHPSMGVYVEMLGRVIMEFANFAMTYVVLIIGFACGFIVLFPDNGMFETEYNFLPFVKSLLIMNGETDYETLFDENENPRVEDLAYSIGAHIIFVGFIIVVTIVLMNLLLGLAVSDIQKLQSTAELSKTQRIVEQIDLLETVFYSKMMPDSMKTWYKNRFSIQMQCQRCSPSKYPVLFNDGPIFRFSPMYPGSLPGPLNDQFTEYLSAGQCTKMRNQTEEEPTLRDLKLEISSLTDQIKELTNAMQAFKHNLAELKTYRAPDLL